MACLHKRFITDCHRRLEALLISLRGGGSVVFRSLSQALYTLTAPIVPGNLYRYSRNETIRKLGPSWIVLLLCQSVNSRSAGLTSVMIVECNFSVGYGN